MTLRPHGLVLAIYLSARGFAFVLFEGHQGPVDWGMKQARREHKNERCLAAIGHLINRYRPGVVVLQDMSLHGTRRAIRIRRLNLGIMRLAHNTGAEVVAFSRRDVMQVFATAAVETKRQLAEAIALRIPSFKRYLPPIRKPWMSEDARMSLFEAAALGWAFFHRSNVEQSSA
jgi:hypothetical protein